VVNSASGGRTAPPGKRRGAGCEFLPRRSPTAGELAERFSIDANDARERTASSGSCAGRCCGRSFHQWEGTRSNTPLQSIVRQQACLACYSSVLIQREYSEETDVQDGELVWITNRQDC